MYAPQAYFSLLFFTTLFDVCAAEYLARIKASVTEPAYLFPRQTSTDASCETGATSCNDGQPGCCNVGQACTFDASHRPICAGSCSGLLLCSGNMAGLCCNTGLTCNTQSTLCVSNDLTMTSIILTGLKQTRNSTIVATMIVTASSSVPTNASVSTSQAISNIGTRTLSQTTSTSTANTFLSTSSGPYYSYTLPTSTFAGPGLYFTYTTVVVTDTSSSSKTASASPEGGNQVPKTMTAVAKSGQDNGDLSLQLIMFGCVMALTLYLL